MNWKFLRCWNVLVVLGVIGVSLSISAQPAWINDGLIAHYPFDGDATDASGNGNHVIATNYKGGVDRFGRSNNSVLLEGRKAQNLTVPTKNITGTRTISAWFSSDHYSANFRGLPLDAAPQGDSRFIFSIGPNSDQRFGIYLRKIDDDDDNSLPALRVGLGAHSNNFFATQVPIADDGTTWTHVLVAVDD